MRTLIVGIGALGGLVAARMQASGFPVWLATRNAESALALKRSGLHVTGVGGDVSVKAPDVAALDKYFAGSSFDLIMLATKAQDAIDTAPRLARLLGAGGVLLPIQNGGVSQLLAERLGVERVLGGLSNLGATMSAPGVYEQRNAGHLLIGEPAGGASARVERVSRWLGQGVEVRETPNLHGAVWSKLLLNCSVTTLGAVAGRTMRRYIDLPEGRELFERIYEETLRVALATGVRPEPMIVDPMPPDWNGQITRGAAHDAWIGQILKAYGDLKPSMLQDFERGRPTEIDFINGYVVSLGRQLRISTPLNEAIVETVQAITRRQLASGPILLTRILAGARR